MSLPAHVAPEPGPRPAAETTPGERDASVEGRLFGDFAVTMAARVGSVALALPLTIALTALLGPTGFGRLNVLLLLPYLIIDIAGGWTSSAVLVIGREEHERTGTVGLTTWARASLVAPLVVIVVAALVVAKAVFGVYREFDWTVIALALLVGPALLAFDHFVQCLQAVGRMRLSAAAFLVQRTAIVVGLGALLVSGIEAGLAEVLLVLCLGGLVGAATLLAGVGRTALSPLALDRAHLRRLLTLSLPLIVLIVANFGLRWSGVVSLELLVSTTAVGVYSVAFQAYATSYVALTAGVVSVFAPLLVSLRLRGDQAVARAFHERLVPLVALVLAVVLGLMAAPAQALIPVVFGEEFSAAGPALVVLLAALHLNIVGAFFVAVCMSMDRSRAIARAAVAGLGASIAGHIALVPVLGLLGAAVATVIGAAVTTALLVRASADCLSATSANWVLTAMPLALAIGVLRGLGLDAFSAILAVTGAVLTGAAILRYAKLSTAQDDELLERFHVPRSFVGVLSLIRSPSRQ